MFAGNLFTIFQKQENIKNMLRVSSKHKTKMPWIYMHCYNPKTLISVFCAFI